MCLRHIILHYNMFNVYICTSLWTPYNSTGHMLYQDQFILQTSCLASTAIVQVQLISNGRLTIICLLMRFPSICVFCNGKTTELWNVHRAGYSYTQLLMHFAGVAVSQCTCTRTCCPRHAALTAALSCHF